MGVAVEIGVSVMAGEGVTVGVAKRVLVGSIWKGMIGDWAGDGRPAMMVGWAGLQATRSSVRRRVYRRMGSIVIKN